MRPFPPAWFRAQRLLMRRRWYLWPMVLVLAVYGTGGLAWCLYNRWWDGAALTVVWLAGLAYLFGPSKVAWDERRARRG